MTTDCSVQIPSGRNHVFAFFSTMDEGLRVLHEFYKGRFDGGEKAAHIVPGEDREEYIKRLAETGINVDKMVAAGQLDVLPRTDMYVRDHHFDQDAMLNLVENVNQSGAHAGYARTKLVGHHMRWLIADKAAVSKLMDNEARLNLLLSKYDSSVIRNCNLSKFGASVAIDIMLTHPLVIIGGLLREDPFFIPPDQVPT
jgi:hypothetical protein